MPLTVICIFDFRDNFRQLVVDASLISQKCDIPESTLDSWLTVSFIVSYILHLLCWAPLHAHFTHVDQEMKLLSQGMAEAAFLQYATNLNKIEVHEFIAFAKVKNAICAFLSLFGSVLLNRC